MSPNINIYKSSLNLLIAHDLQMKCLIFNNLGVFILIVRNAVETLKIKRINQMDIIRLMCAILYKYRVIFPT